MKKAILSILLVSSLTLWQCSSSSDSVDDTGDAEACNTLCTDSNFDSGDEIDFGGGLIECTCAGEGDGIEQTACADYCADFDVSEENSILSTNETEHDKCVCDGTTP